MTNEEFERAVDFLLKSQANNEARIEQTNEQLRQLAATVDQLSAAVAQHNFRLDAFADTQVEVMRILIEVANRQAKTEEVMTRLAAGQERTEEALTKLTQKVDTLADAQTGTDRRLDRLARIVEEERGR